MCRCCWEAHDRRQILVIRMSHVVPATDGIATRSEGTTREVKPSVRSPYIHSFSTESKNSFLNTTRWSRIVQTFLSTSTLHGVSHLRPPCSRRQKGFWLFAILSCGTFFLVHASVLVYNALTRNEVLSSTVLPSSPKNNVANGNRKKGRNTYVAYLYGNERVKNSVIDFDRPISFTNTVFYSTFSRPSLSTTLTLKYRDLDGPLLNQYDRITKFPGITVCGLTPFKNQESGDSFSLLMYYALSLGYPYSALTLEQRIKLHEVATKPEEWINFHNSTLWVYKEKIRNFTSSTQREDIADILWKNSYRCEDVFSQCTVGYEIMNCCSIFIPVLTTYGYCYALQINDTSLGALEMETLPFIIDLHVPPSNTTDSEEGYLLLVHDPRFTPRMILPKDGLLVAPGVTMSLRLTLRITDYSAKYAKWFGLVTECPKVSCMGEDYSIQECVFQNAAHKIRDNCRCSWILDECRSGSTEIPICGPKEMIECVITQAARILSDLLKMCQPPCLEYIFEAATSYAQLRYNYSLQERQVTYTRSSDIGGAMGLLLGASCLTGIELLTFLGQWIYFTFFEK